MTDLAVAELIDKARKAVERLEYDRPVEGDLGIWFHISAIDDALNFPGVTAAALDPTGQATEEAMRERIKLAIQHAFHTKYPSRALE